ncbi:Nif3-like dinuclear metal center hexameric protein [Desulfurispira natronophila]|uniref:GTP cyclohydrolase 1 type 2 homolog n=1 Tax=Desulfurispira natronophila TaxID=682562 RepID=A0A7W7Y5R9_9BACT|nr:Nif3-like dinuclear metal center hexameric protein [Desulfurispira natronophila]MBB5022595.1 dinuclear metal center YbgI/SA1388 family protein [Desulfurispira natronophila]
MSITMQHLATCLETLAPLCLAQEWDNCGFMTGTPTDIIQGVLLSLDVHPETIEEATERGANLIVTHHPLMMSPTKQLVVGSKGGHGLAIQALQKGISIYSSHTNLDIAWGGLNDHLAKLIQLNVEGVLESDEPEGISKMVVYLPVDEDVLESISQAMYKAGAGILGDFTHRAFISQGRGTYKNLSDQLAKMNEECDEYRLEATAWNRDIANITNAIYMSHPYHTPPIDIIPMHNQASHHGLGRIGSFNEAHNLQSLTRLLKSTLSLSHVVVADGGKQQLQRAAVVSGSGGSLVKVAKRCRADVYITGDLKYHDALWAVENGLTVIDCGHFGTESIFCQLISDYISSTYPQLPVMTSQRMINPLQVW